MTTFTKTQVQAIMQAQQVAEDVTVEQFAEQMGFTLQQQKQARSSKRAEFAGLHSIVVLSCAERSECIFTTNAMYTGRDKAWIQAEWEKITRTSREHYRALVTSETLDITIMPPMAAKTAEEMAALDKATAEVLYEFEENNYKCLNKIKKAVRAHMNVLADANKKVAEEATEQATDSVKECDSTTPPNGHYNAVQGATGTQDTGYKHNPKTNRMIKDRSKKAK